MNFECVKTAENIFEVSATGRMRVPLRIYATSSMIDKMLSDRTVVQGMNVACLPGIQRYSIVMPDGHEGYGFPIGGVAALDRSEGGISPGGIGYDINCGVRLLASDISRRDMAPKVKEVVERVFRYCPAGLGSSNFNIGAKDLDAILKTGAKWAVSKGFGRDGDLEFCEEGGSMEGADPGAVGDTAKKRGHGQMATLGSGNHFIEIQYVDEIFDELTARAFGIFEKGQVVFMIHCGSRALGHQVCSDYLRAMEKQFPKLLTEVPDRELIYAPAGSEMAVRYYSAMCASANFAWCNRHMLAHQLRLAVGEYFKSASIDTVYDVAHNIAKIEKHQVGRVEKELFVHRKGATRALGPGSAGLPAAYAQIGQPVLIPGSMGTASYLLVGTERSSADTFGSSAHGAGRMMSRNEALRRFRGDKIAKELEHEGIFVRGASLGGIAEEAAAAYKNIDEVVEVSHAASLGRKIARFMPLGVIKG